MVVHELIANAAKYGALSQPEGHVGVSWDVRPDGDTRSLQLEWIERDGPTVHAPTHHGFGERLLKRMHTVQTQAELRTEYRPEGLRFIVDLPLSLRNDEDRAIWIFLQVYNTMPWCAARQTGVPDATLGVR